MPEAAPDTVQTMPEATPDTVQTMPEATPDTVQTMPEAAPSANLSPAEKLSLFLAQHSDLPKQGTREWEILREGSIGGSEIGSIMGLNPYKSRKNFLLDKVIPSENGFRGNPATNWGKLFEDVTQRYIEAKWGITIFETSSVPGTKPKYSYSPDGLAVVRFPGEDTDKIVLFEIKSPFTRIPNDTIPEMYGVQPMYGMFVIPIVDTSFFVDVAYRKCRLCDFDVGCDTIYDHVYHKNDKPGCLPDMPICGGIIGVYSETVPDYMQQLILLDPMEQYKPKDFGTYYWSAFNQAIANINNGIHKKYIPTITTEPKDQFAEFLDFCLYNKYTAIGVIPWKMFKYYEIRLDRDETFIQKIITEVDDAYSILKQCKRSGNPLSTMEQIVGAVRKVPTKREREPDPEPEIQPMSETEQAELMQFLIS
jgi:putative phage-type endonuclease